MYKQRSQSGQAGLVAILIAMVLSVIGLSVASRASREALISTGESEGTRTLEGAQSGAESALQTGFSAGSTPVPAPGTDTGGTGSSNTTFQSEVASEINPVQLDLILEEGMSLELHNSNNYTVQWGDVNEAQQAGLLFSCYYDGGKNAIYQAYKPYGGNYGGDYSGSSEFRTAANGSGGFRSQVTATGVWSGTGVPNCEITRMKALYATTVIRVTGVAAENIRQVRAAATNEQDDQGRLVEVRETSPGRPSVLDYALFAGSGAIEKN